MLIYQHHTADDVIELDRDTGLWRHVDEDEAIAPGELAISWRHSYPIAGSYTVEDGHRYCMYWSAGKTLLLRTPDQIEYPLFRYLGDGRYQDLRAGLTVTLDAAHERDGSTRAGYNAVRVLDAGGAVLHEATYHAQPYLDLYLSDFSAGDRDLGSWDFFVDLTRGIEEMAEKSVPAGAAPLLAGAAAPVPDASADTLLQARSGQPCPRAGTWVAAERLDARQRFDQGAVLPRHDGHAVTWLWVDA